MGEFASKGVAGTGLGLGIAGTALGVLGGGLGNLLGNLGGQPAAQVSAAQDATAASAVLTAAAALAANGRGTCNEDHTVNRYEAQKDARIAELETEVKREISRWWLTLCACSIKLVIDISCKETYKMKSITLLATGGTIASVQSPDGLTPGVSAAELLELMPQLTADGSIVCRDVFSLDSSNIQPEEWRELARAAYGALNETDGVVITHGTDTMAYSAAALSFMLRDPKGPVVFTGSQLPMKHPFSDAPVNLNEAIAVARSAPPGVYVVFNHKVIHGARAVKLRTTSFDAFDSINARPAGVIDADGIHYTDTSAPAAGVPALLDQLDPRVFLLKLMPGTAPEVFDWIISAGFKGVVVEAFGLGGMHYIRRNLVDKLRLLSEHGIYTIVTTQCMYEKTNFSIYEVGHGVLSDHVFSGGDMTSEAAVAKLMWVLGDPASRAHTLACGAEQG